MKRNARSILAREWRFKRGLTLRACDCEDCAECDDEEAVDEDCFSSKLFECWA